MLDFWSHYALGFVFAIGIPVSIALLVIFILAIVLFTVVSHELGHILAARLLGIPVQLVHFGHGPIWRIFRIFGLPVIICQPFGIAYVRVYSLIHVGILSELIFYLGGIIVNFTIFYISALMSKYSNHDYVANILTYISISQIFVALTNLWPFKIEVAPGLPFGSDGQRILDLLRSGLKTKSALRVYWLGDFARRGAPPARLDAAAARVIGLSLQSVPADPQWRKLHWEDMERERKCDHVLSVRLALLDGGITKMLYDDRKADLARLADWAEEFRRLAPDVSTVRGSLGAVSVLLGRPSEGRPGLLAAAAEGTIFDRFISMAFLARVDWALGDRMAAEKALAEAYRIGEGQPELRNTPAWQLVTGFAAEIGYAPAPLPAIAPA